MPREPKPQIDAKKLRQEMAQHIELKEAFYNPRSPYAEVYANQCKQAFLGSETLANYYVLRSKLRETYFGEPYKQPTDLDNELPF